MGICRHYIHDENMAKDVLHDAFIIIFTSIKSLKDNSKLEGWMIAIVRNLALKCLHDTERTEIPLSCLDIEIPDEKSEARKAIELEALLSAIDALPKGSREVFKLSVLDSLSHKEIASLLVWVSIHTVLLRNYSEQRRCCAPYWSTIGCCFCCPF